MNITTLSPQQLRKADDIQENIQSLQEELGQLLGGETTTPAQTTEAPKKRKFSAYTRAKMRAAQQARWAKIKGTAPSAQPAQKPKRKRKMTAAWRRALERAWAAKRAKAKAASSSVPTEKSTEKKQVSDAKLRALAKAREARWAKVRAAKKASR